MRGELFSLTEHWAFPFPNYGFYNLLEGVLVNGYVQLCLKNGCFIKGGKMNLSY